MFTIIAKKIEKIPDKHPLIPPAKEKIIVENSIEIMKKFKVVKIRHIQV